MSQFIRGTGWLERLDIDRAVFFALAQRAWQLSAGVVSALLIASCLSPAAQGYYYTFGSILALQSFFELGFQIVVLNAASHEWAHLRLDEKGRIAPVSKKGPRSLSRLVGLGRLVFIWYAVLALAFVIVVGVGGMAFFLAEAARAAGPSPDWVPIWRGPWWTMVVLSGLLLWTLPFNALLEGCGQVAVVNQMRFLQAVTANFALWTGLLCGGVLWSAALATAARLGWEFYFLLLRYRRFFQPFLHPRSMTTWRHTIPWRRELWPMQWRLALSGLFSYLEFFLFAPIMFHYHSAAVAGRMGMTWTLISVLQMASLAWVQSRAPLFGRLVATNDQENLDREFWKTTKISLIAIVVGSIAVCTGTALLAFVDDRPFSFLAKRLLAPLPTTLFAVAAVVYHLPKCIDFYIRAHKKEIMMPVNIVQNLMIGASVWILGARYGPIGAAVGYLSVILLFTFPLKIWLFRRFRRQRRLPK